MAYRGSLNRLAPPRFLGLLLPTVRNILDVSIAVSSQKNILQVYRYTYLKSGMDSGNS